MILVPSARALDHPGPWYIRTDWFLKMTGRFGVVFYRAWLEDQRKRFYSNLAFNYWLNDLAIRIFDETFSLVLLNLNSLEKVPIWDIFSQMVVV